MKLSSLRRRLEFLRYTPLHPQWLVFRHEKRTLARIAAGLQGNVLDLGCGHQPIRKFLGPETRYTGLDYYRTVTEWYHTRPDVFGDAQNLPIRSASVDHVLLLDVLEHLPRPDRCIAEIARILRSGGSLTIQVPFLYPVHDAPLDFHRWTQNGLGRLASNNGFHERLATYSGNGFETAALMANIACAQAIVQWAKRRNPLAILILLLPVTTLAVNLAGWLFGRLAPQWDGMAMTYLVEWSKEPSH
jgi:SAM-dependent methyltransferase